MKTKTVLVGEDELEVREYLEMALKCLGYSVELAQDGDEVLCLPVILARRRSAAVLLDIMMPQKDGIETLQEIRRIDPDLPVIIVSGASSTLNVVTAMRSGATDFLCKPVAHEELRKALSKALDTRDRRRPAPAAPDSHGTATAKTMLSRQQPHECRRFRRWSNRSAGRRRRC